MHIQGWPSVYVTYGNGFWVNLNESENRKRVPGIKKKRNKSFSYHTTPNRPNKDKNLIPARIPHITNTLNMCVESKYLYMYISSTLAAILMTSSFGPTQNSDG